MRGYFHSTKTTNRSSVREQSWFSCIWQN